MYKRNAYGWMQQLSFMVIDLICLQIVFLAAVFLRNQFFAYSRSLYQMMGINLILVEVLVFVLNHSMRNVINRGFFIELKETFKHSFLVFAITTIYMFATQSGDVYSRIILFLTFVFHFLFGYLTRIIWKAL